MVKYYGRAKLRTSAVNTNAPGIKMSGSASTVGCSYSTQRYINRRVNSLAGVCGMPKQNGSSWRQSLKNKPPYCRPGASKCLAAAGTVGHIKTPYKQMPKSGEKGCGQQSLCQKIDKAWNRVNGRGGLSEKYPNYELCLVGVTETIMDDLSISNGVSADFIKFYDATLYTDIPNTPLNHYNLYPHLHADIYVINQAAHNLGKLKVIVNGISTYQSHILALVPINTKSELKDKGYYLPRELGGCINVIAYATNILTLAPPREPFGALKDGKVRISWLPPLNDDIHVVPEFYHVRWTDPKPQVGTVPVTFPPNLPGEPYNFDANLFCLPPLDGPCMCYGAYSDPPCIVTVTSGSKSASSSSVQVKWEI